MDQAPIAQPDTSFKLGFILHFLCKLSSLTLHLQQPSTIPTILLHQVHPQLSVPHPLLSPW